MKHHCKVKADLKKSHDGMQDVAASTYVEDTLAIGSFHAVAKGISVYALVAILVHIPKLS